jgi:2-C-methyl-D-erythritol 2,4-cyclodiphosphate synthase
MAMPSTTPSPTRSWAPSPSPTSDSSFPTPRHESQDSEVFLVEAAKRVHAAGFRISNLDCTVILEKPKLSPVKDQMRANIARVLGLELSQVNLKGKTHEKVDAVGEGRAVEVHVVALLVPAQT